MFHVELQHSDFDVVVIGGGHAGIEAASASARMGMRVALVTADSTAIGRLSCNPAIGGMAKGQLVREIDALGGEMGRIADLSGIQFKMLGTSKGPAMWSPRSQNDITLYPQYAQERLAELPNLTVLSAHVVDVTTKNRNISGVILEDGCSLSCRAVILCAGTFLCGRMHTGEQCIVGGRVGELSAEGISGSLQSVGFVTGRLKTGTPPRILMASIDVSKCGIDAGDASPRPFSFSTQQVDNKISCYTTSTTPATHQILASAFDRSPMFSGRISGKGPRYCPSVEDKIYRFADKSSHPIFLEPESLQGDSVYVNGFSTSMPIDVQEEALRTVPGLEQCRVIRYGYAVEYDYFPSYQLYHTLESKLVGGLYFAGQVNGTSGYEEAAAQGLVAGINAALKLKGDAPFILDRAEAYIGVLIDDLINLTVDEPYRMFTSRSEYRLLLRQDNADLRLSEKGYRLGLVSAERWDVVSRKAQEILKGRNLLETMNVEHDVCGEDSRGSQKTKAWQWLKRPGNDLRLLGDVCHSEDIAELLHIEGVAEQLEIEARYGGYIARQIDEVEAFRKNEEMLIPESIDYSRIHSISAEGREKLTTIRPRSIGQASRIAGVSRSDVAVLLLYLK